MKQTKTNKQKNNDAQVGIGTLIVFIAMVLVAAIAAAVLVNTAGLLQSQAEQTGQESTDQVSNKLQVYSTTGYVESDGGPVDSYFFTVGKAAGSDDIDTGALTIELTGPSSNSRAAPGDYSVGKIVTGDSNAGNTLDEPEDRFNITIDTDNTGTPSISGPTLNANEEMDVTFITADGSETSLTVSAPDSMAGDAGIQVAI